MARVAREAWHRLGALPAVVAVGGLSALAGATALLLGDRAAPVALALLALFVLHCVARPADRGEVLGCAVLPNVGRILHEAAGAPAWLTYALIPVALLGAFALDGPREEDDGPALSHPPGAPGCDGGQAVGPGAAAAAARTASRIAVAPVPFST
jgi:hypothetical protein